MTYDEDVYLTEHLHEALLTDERVGEQSLRLWIDGRCIHVAGTVATEARRAAIVAVIDERAPGREICNEVEVVHVAPLPDVEDLA